MMQHQQEDDDDANRIQCNESQQKSISAQRIQFNSHKMKDKVFSAVEIKAATIRQHYYPEGSWGWVIIIIAMLSHIITSGLQLSFGIFLIYLTKQSFARDKYMDGVWVGSISISVAYFLSPIVVSYCRRKSTRLTAIVGGLIASLGCLFASFASQFHQLMLSYGIFMGIGVGIVKESANLMVGQYFKRKRPFVEIFIQSSFGIGISVMSLLLNWSFNIKHWRAALQLITCALFVTFFIAVLYRPASIYHPQRRAILHLKTQRRKIREKNPNPNKPPFFDLTPLKTRSIQIIMTSAAIFSFGFLSPIFFLTKLTEWSAIILDDTSRISKMTLNLQIYFGIAFIVGVVIVGYITTNNNAECRINRQYLCQTVMVLNAFLLIVPIYLNDYYYGYLLFVICYGVSMGSFFYIFKMLLFENVRAKMFGKAWAWVQWAQSIPILLGIPITGYINASHHSYGFAFSSICCFIGGLILCALSSSKSRSETTMTKGIDMCQHQHQHHSSPTDTNQGMDLHSNPANVNSYSSDSAFGDGKGQCCNCGQNLPINETLENVNDDCGPPSPKRYRTDDGDFDDDDDDFVYNKFQTHAAEMGTFFSEDLYNYYLQNEYEYDDGDGDGDGDGVYCNHPDAVKDRILPLSEVDDDHLQNNSLGLNNPRNADDNGQKHINCDNTVANKYVTFKRTIDTVDEETSNC